MEDMDKHYKVVITDESGNEILNTETKVLIAGILDKDGKKSASVGLSKSGLVDVANVAVAAIRSIGEIVREDPRLALMISAMMEMLPDSRDEVFNKLVKEEQQVQEEYEEY